MSCELQILFSVNLDSFVLNEASAQTKDCLHLLKLLGVPSIQVLSVQHKLYSIYSFMFIFSSLSFCLALFILTPSLVLWWAPGSRGRWGTMRPAGERRDCGRGGIRGHGHAAVWSQYCNSPAERQEGQVATVHSTLMLAIFQCTL